jgi:hypothetical protein
VPEAGHDDESPSARCSPTGEASAPRKPGLPAPESIVGESEFTSPKGFKYRIIHTDEVDPGDEPKTTKTRRSTKKGRRPK